jgi:hypothetical protein
MLDYSGDPLSKEQTDQKEEDIKGSTSKLLQVKKTGVVNEE